MFFVKRLERSTKHEDINCDRNKTDRTGFRRIKMLKYSLYWLAGIIDGEGSFTIEQNLSGKSVLYSPKIIITNTSTVLIKKINRILKQIKIHYYCLKHKSIRHDGYKRKPCYDIQICKFSEILKLINYIGNKLIIKRKEAKLMEKFCKHRITERKKVTRNADAHYTTFEPKIYKQFIKIHGRRINAN